MLPKFLSGGLPGRGYHCHRRRRSVNDLGRGALDPVVPGTQAKLVHDAAHMIRIVPDAVALLDGGRETRGGPAVIGETGRPGDCAEELRNALLLFQVEAAGPAGGSTLAKRLHARTVQRAMPARCRSPAHPKFACDLGLS